VQLARILCRGVEHSSDVAVLVVEHLLEEEDGTLLRRQPFEQDEKRERHRLGALEHGIRTFEFGGEHGLGQPRPDILLAHRTRRLQAIETETRHRRRHECRRRSN
jgi:hypothetical protein